MLVPIIVPMRLFFPVALLSLVLAAPAWADEATLEGYGGDGALLVGVGGGDSPFGDRAPAAQGGGNRGDGNLVAERGPAPGGGTQGAATQPAPAPAQPTPVSPSERPSNTGGNRDRTRSERDRRPAEGGREPQPDRPQQPQVVLEPAPDEPAPVTEGAEASGGNSSGLPFTNTELLLLLAGLVSLALMGVAMQRLAASQPRF